MPPNPQKVEERKRLKTKIAKTQSPVQIDRVIEAELVDELSPTDVNKARKMKSKKGKKKKKKNM